MSAPPAGRPLTVEEFERLPARDGIQELLDGVVVEMAPLRRRHSEIVQAVEAILLRYLDRKRVWVETGFLIGRHCPQPDVAAVHPGQGTERGWFAGAPMIAVEIASRGNTPEELEFKKELYLANGAHEVWIVYDKTRTVVCFEPGGLGQTHRVSFMSVALGGEVSVAGIFAA